MDNKCDDKQYVTGEDQSDSVSVLMLSEDFYPKTSGGAFIDWNVAKHLASKGDEITVVTPRSELTTSSESIEGIEIRRPFSGSKEGQHPNTLYNQFRRIIFVIVAFPYTIQLIYRQGFDLIYSTNHLFHPVASALRFMFGLPLITFVGYSPSMHDDLSYTNPLLLLERLNFRLFMGDRCLCQTPSIQEELINVTHGVVERIDGIVDEDAIASATSLSEEPLTERSPDSTKLIFVGRLVSIKNAEKLPSIIAQLPKEYSLLIVGDGPHRPIVEEAVEKAGVGDRVQFTGEQNHIQALQEIHKSDILLLPSETESYGAVVFEALALNTSVLATPVGVLPTVDHSRLNISTVDKFAEKIELIEPCEKRGIDHATLDKFSVNTFSSSVRSQMLESIEKD